MSGFIECSSMYGQYKESKFFNSAIKLDNICSISKSKTTMYYGAEMPEIRFKMNGETKEVWTYGPQCEKQRDADYKKILELQ